MILHGPGIPGPAVDRRATTASPSNTKAAKKVQVVKVTKDVHLSRLRPKEAYSKLSELKSLQRFKISKSNLLKSKENYKKVENKDRKVNGLASMLKNSRRSRRMDKGIKEKMKVTSKNEKNIKETKKLEEEMIGSNFRSIKPVCKYHGSCEDDHFPIGSVHVMEGAHVGHGSADYGHNGVSYESDYGLESGHLLHTDGFSHLGSDYGYHGSDYGHHGMDYGHHGMDYGHHGSDYGHHGMDYDSHHLSIEPIRVADEHHNHVEHHIEPVPVAVPVPVPATAPNPAPSVANKAAADAISNKAPDGVAVSAMNMNGGKPDVQQNNAAQTVNTGYPIYYLPPSAPPAGKPAPNLVKPVPPANGPNPYEILTSDTLREAAGQQKNEAGGASSGGASSGGASSSNGDNNSNDCNNNNGGNANKDEKKPKEDDKDDKKPATLVNGGGGKHRPVNTEVDHSSHFSRKNEIVRAEKELRGFLRRNVRSLFRVLLARNLKHIRTVKRRSNKD